MVDELAGKLSVNFSKNKYKQSCVLKLPSTHFDGYNLWFLKVTKLNRGRGIYVFDTLDKLHSLIKDLEEGIITNPNAADAQNVSIEETYREKVDPTFSNVGSVPSKIQSSTFVIQKYIEKPLLLNNRKFDIRVWVMLSHDLKLYFFKEGYLRTS